MEIYQSYLSAVLKGKFSLYEIRIIIGIVKSIQPYFAGKNLNKMIDEEVCIDGINLNMSFKTKSLLTCDSHHYEDIQEAAVSLEKKIVEHYEPNKKKWLSSPFIYNVCIDYDEGIIRFSAAKWLIESIVDMCKGFTHYDFKAALSLDSSYSTRLYIIFASINRPIQFRVDLLKEILGVADKYAQTRDFLKRVIDPSIDELEKKQLNGFRYEKIYKGRKVTALQIIPIKRQKKTDEEMAAMAQLGTFVEPLLKSILMTRCGFTYAELSAHKPLLMKFGNMPIWQDAIYDIIERQRTKRASKGYIINAMRSTIDEFDNGTTKKNYKR